MTSRFAAVLALVAGAGAACKGTQDPNAITASGHVEATQVRVAAKTPGTLSTLSVDEGDRVTAGQAMAEIDTTDVELALAAARAERAQAEAELRLRAAGSRKEDIAEAGAQVARAAGGPRRRPEGPRAHAGPAGRGSGTPKSRDDARTRRDVAAARADGARASARAGLDARQRGRRRSTPRARAWPRADARIAQLEQQMKDADDREPGRAAWSRRRSPRPGELLPRGQRRSSWSPTSPTPGSPSTSPSRTSAASASGQAAEVVTDDGQTRAGQGHLRRLQGRVHAARTSRPGTSA